MRPDWTRPAGGRAAREGLGKRYPSNCFPKAQVPILGFAFCPKGCEWGKRRGRKQSSKSLRVFPVRRILGVVRAAWAATHRAGPFFSLFKAIVAIMVDIEEADRVGVRARRKEPRRCTGY